MIYVFIVRNKNNVNLLRVMIILHIIYIDDNLIFINHFVTPARRFV